jgi:hypothetical protein
LDKIKSSLDLVNLLPGRNLSGPWGLRARKSPGRRQKKKIKKLRTLSERIVQGSYLARVRHNVEKRGDVRAVLKCPKTKTRTGSARPLNNDEGSGSEGKHDEKVV